MNKDDAIFCYVMDMFIGEKWRRVYIQVSSQEEGEKAVKEVKNSIEKGVDAQRLLDGIESYVDDKKNI